jgi:K+-sensing histidine kinase KdpD
VQGLKMGMLDERKESEYLDKLLYRSEQLEMIASDILDCTYEMNNIELSKKVVNLNDYVNMISFNSENHIINTNREFKKNIKIIDNECYVEIDIIKIQRVLNNIISNAVKFSEELSIIELIIEQDGDRIITKIKDEGKGLENVDKNKTFNMFYKSEGQEKGYGLGLYISKAIIEAHGGEIFLSHNKNKGANCGFILKCNKKS